MKRLLTELTLSSLLVDLLSFVVMLGNPSARAIYSILVGCFEELSSCELVVEHEFEDYRAVGILNDGDKASSMLYTLCKGFFESRKVLFLCFAAIGDKEMKTAEQIMLAMSKATW